MGFGSEASTNDPQKRRPMTRKNFLFLEQASTNDPWITFLSSYGRGYLMLSSVVRCHARKKVLFGAYSMRRSIANRLGLNVRP